MVFSSIIFLFFFFPLAILLSLAAPQRAKNLVLLLMSCIFYYWGEGLTVLHLLLVSLLVYACGRMLGNLDGADEDAAQTRFRRKAIVGVAVAANLSLLAYFKYANFFVEEILLNPLENWIHVALPIGISFYTFQAISYVIDVYRREVEPEKSFIGLACYICSFPQLVAGPIVRYKDIRQQLAIRTTSLEGFTQGMNRFFLGLIKKVLIANPLALCADTMFALPADKLGIGEAWLGATTYTLQIYYDFSAYSDMAIGLGLMLGFTFPENFNYPYTAKSIQEFWRRWHISLSTWFRDYLYIPMGGSRGSTLATYFNLWTVFLLCGFWHGAAWTFMAWGAYHGAFLVLERTSFGRLLAAAPPLLRHIYALLVIIAGWVFFRAETIGQAFDFLRAGVLLGQSGTNTALIAGSVTNDVLIALILGSIFSAPVKGIIADWANGLSIRELFKPAHSCILVSLVVLCLFRLSADTYNPFLYFRF